MHLLPLSVAIAAAVTLMASPASHAEPVRFDIDPHHTFPSFEGDHMGISVWRGKFNKTEGRVVLDRAAGAGTVEVRIDPASIDFGHEQLNRWAQGRDFLDVAQHPQARYVGRLEAFQGGAPTRVSGELTLHGVTRPVTLQVLSFKCIEHPMLKREMCGADALATIQRDAFGLDAGKAYGFKMDVTLRIQVEAVAIERGPAD